MCANSTFPESPLLSVNDTIIVSSPEFLIEIVSLSVLSISEFIPSKYTEKLLKAGSANVVPERIASSLESGLNTATVNPVRASGVPLKYTNVPSIGSSSEPFKT